MQKSDLCLCGTYVGVYVLRRDVDTKERKRMRALRIRFRTELRAREPTLFK
jgi:hypothetical protein